MSAAHDQIASAIVQGQVKMIGKVALSLAGKVPGVTVDDTGHVTIDGDGVSAIEGLVRQYSALTGQLGVRMCYTSAKSALESNPSVVVPSFASFAA
jgi:hypothetical protein